VSNVQGTTFHF